MINHLEQDINKSLDQNWPWWPLLPLYPYGKKSTLFRELIPGQIWSFEQLQGLYYVAVPVRLTVVKVQGGLMVLNPLPPTGELLRDLYALESKHGPVLTIVLPTASGLEHKISLPAFARAFPKAKLWICPGQWSFPFNVSLELLGIPKIRTKTLSDDGFPHGESCSWSSLGPLDLGLGRFQEFSCFHKASNALLVTDALVSIDSDPPELFEFDPTPLLFHARDRGDQPLEDTPSQRRKGWLRLILFASFLRPEKLSIPPLTEILKYAFKPGLCNFKAHFGLFPFSWLAGWEKSAEDLIGNKRPYIQIAPVLQRLVFPRAKGSYISWLEDLYTIKSIRWLVSAHYSAPVKLTSREIKDLTIRINSGTWVTGKGDWRFLNSLDQLLLKRGIVPSDPLEAFKD